jgi:hypothetical protein
VKLKYKNVHTNNKNKLNNTKKSVKILLLIIILNKILFRFILNSESGKNWLGHHNKDGGHHNKDGGHHSKRPLC